MIQTDQTSSDQNPLRPGWVLSVVIPAYNEADGIAQIVERVLAIRPALAEVGIQELELIVVDDGSSDRTAEIVAACSGVKLIRHPTNRGYGAALKTGFQAATGQLIGFLDADGTYPPEFFPRLCQAILQGAEMAVGSRRSGAASEMPLVRRIGNLIWSTLVSLLSGQKIADPASGMRVFRREVLEKLYPLPDALNLTPVMSTRAAHEQVKMVEVAIPYKERLGRSKLNVVHDGMRFLRTIVWTALTYNPVRIFGIAGVVLALLGLLIALIIIGTRLAGITTLGPWGVTGTFTAVVFGIAGINLFALGVTFNYLVSLFHKRPVRQGLFGRLLFKTPLEQRFGWMGLCAIFVGLGLGLGSFLLALQDWPIVRLWLYLLAGTMFTLVGIQLITFWIIVQVLDELQQREIQIQNDMGKN